MLATVTLGNAARDGAAHKQWFIGPFVDAAVGPRRTGHLEVKWGIHPRGQGREAWASGQGMTTVSVLVRGRFRLEFRDPADRSRVLDATLEAEGDYALWTPEVEHTWVAVEDSVVVTVRWREPAPGDNLGPP